MKTLLLAVALVAGVSACKKSKPADADHAAPSAASGSAAPVLAPTPEPTPTSAAGSAGAAVAAAATDVSDDDCATYATTALKCASAPGDVGMLEKTCRATLAKNNPMTASMKAQVACAKASAECEAYKQCLTKP